MEMNPPAITEIARAIAIARTEVTAKHAVKPMRKPVRTATRSPIELQPYN